MPVLDALCRRYQALFRPAHPEAERLRTLHEAGATDDYAGFLRGYFDHEYEKGDGVLAGFARVSPGWPRGRTLDFGCGAGGLTYRVAQVCREAVGLDLDEQKLAFGRTQVERLGTRNVSLVGYDGGTLPFPDGSFDCILCADVVEHLPTPEFFVREFRRVLAPGGRLLLSFGPPWWHAHGKHTWSKLPGWWTHLLFPEPVVMRTLGEAPGTTWESLGLHRLRVGTFRRIMARSGLARLHYEERIKAPLRPLKLVPWARELFISEVVGVYAKPTA